MYQDLREWLQEMDGVGQVRRVDGADCEAEIGAAVHLTYKRAERPPVLLFDDVPGYPRGRRVASLLYSSIDRFAHTFGYPLETGAVELIDRLRDRLGQDAALLPPRVVRDGPVTANVVEGPDLDLGAFPAPRWHPLDHARYIGTGSICITRDPETGWVNCGTYTAYIAGPQTLGIGIGRGKHAAIHREKHWQSGQPCPMAFCFGSDPLLLALAGTEVGPGRPEMDLAGGIRGEPTDVFVSDLTGLPLPARAEIIAEGFAVQGDRSPKGRWGEWPGYYAGDSGEQTSMRVQRILFRDDPVICGLPPECNNEYHAVQRAMNIRNQLEAAGVPDVVGVWCFAYRLFTVVSIRQRYPGHARQAGLLASQCHGGAYFGRYTIVVDEDVDISNWNEVMWAIGARSDPERSIEIFRRGWGANIDPAIEPGRKGFSSRAIIDACRPYEWKDRFPVRIAYPDEVARRVRERWGLF